MGDMGSGTGSSYPGALDTQSTPEVNSPNAGKTKARAEVPNDSIAAILAVQTELGTDPAGTETDVKTYLQTEHNTDGTHDDTIVALLTGGQTFTGKVTIGADDPQLIIKETDAAANNQNWELTAIGEVFAFRIINDAQDTAVNVFTITRTDTTTVDAFNVLTELKANNGIQTDGTNTLKTKIVNIGDWNMDATGSVSIAHGVTVANIRTVNALLRDDTPSNYYPFPANQAAGASVDGWVSSVNTTNVILTRRETGLFDNATFDATSYNRGWITITYIA